MFDVNKKLSLDVELFNTLLKESNKLFKRPYLAKDAHTEIKKNVQKMIKVISKRKSELTILEDFIKILMKVDSSTYWVFNLADKAEHKRVISDWKKLVNNYRRKIKAMESRLNAVKFYLSLVQPHKSH